MATVGQVLTAPEAGWKRYDDQDTNFTKSDYRLMTDRGSGVWKNTISQFTASGSTVLFNFIGANLRILTGTFWSDGTTIEVFIDGVSKGTIDFTQFGNKDWRDTQLAFERIGLAQQEHSVKIVTLAAGLFDFDCIDIDDAGSLKPYQPVLVNTPTAPTNLVATAGDSQVSLSWTAVTGATGYNVKRATTASGPYITVGANVSTNNYVDTAVTNGTTYYYVVTAINADGESVNSNEASATPVASSKALLRVTMNDSSEREYKLTSTEINDFVKWINQSTNTGNHCYTFNDTIEDSTEYLLFEKIISFKVMSLTK